MLQMHWVMFKSRHLLTIIPKNGEYMGHKSDMVGGLAAGEEVRAKWQSQQAAKALVATCCAVAGSIRTGIRGM